MSDRPSFEFVVFSESILTHGDAHTASVVATSYGAEGWQMVSVVPLGDGMAQFWMQRERQ